MSTASQPLQIDFVSDVMCPWCIVGYRQLVTALEATETPHEIHWHPFELNPEMPPQGQDGREHLAEKYGTTDAQSAANQANITGLGLDLGFQFNFADGFRMHNTFNTHQLLHWAKQHGRMQDLKLALFTAHFTDKRDLSDVRVLAEAASEIGLDKEEALAVLEDQRFAEDVRKNEKMWSDQGVQGVPALIFNNRHLVTGAQGVDNYTNILNQLAQMKR